MGTELILTPEDNVLVYGSEVVYDSRLGRVDCVADGVVDVGVDHAPEEVVAWTAVWGGGPPQVQ